MPTLRQFRREMVAREPAIGRTHAIASLTAQTLTVTALATGTIGAGKFANKWMLRADTATTADRVRMVTDTGFNSTNGVLQHEGTAYVDVTATSESVEILEYEPYYLDTAIQQTLANTRHRDSEIIPTANGIDRYWLQSYLSWLNEPSDISRIYYRAMPVITRNRQMEKWNTVSTAGVLQPDNWTLAGAGAIFTRSTTARRGQYSLSVQRAGADAIISVTIPALVTGVSADSLVSQTVTGVAVWRSANASSARVRVTSENGTGTVLSTTNSSYHTGGGAWEEVTAQHTASTSVEQFTLSARLEVNETALLDELYLIYGTISDSIRRDNSRVLWETRQPQFEQGGLQFIPPHPWGRGYQLVVESFRPYPTFDADRIAAGTADADSSDAPLALIAEGALALFFEGYAKTPEEAALGRKHRMRYEQLATQHLYDKNDRGQGLDLPLALAGAPASRF